MENNIEELDDDYSAKVDVDTKPGEEAKETEKSDFAFFNLSQVCEQITKHYNRTFKQLVFSTSRQLTDGSAVEFTDDEVNAIVATARIRYANKLLVDKTTGELSVQAVLSDLSFVRPQLKLSTEPAQ